ncbi:hypothetical protein CEXT_287871 [Caerostris extrusa]|uniref:Uncharacterized protein n=1 Tax=Caerostris extrusa TaxID=172846 RepID=A0AAV4N0W5_CAEEX|nr:hypothetical protein CEXT_287871 [Caerostris extrusa]
MFLLQIAECAFEADDCILNEHESLTDSGKLKKKERLFAFMMCQKYVEAKYCNDMTAPMSQTTIEMD